MTVEAPPQHGTVEDILREVALLPVTGEPHFYNLWVPESLTYRGEAVQEAVAIAIVGESFSKKGYRRKSFESAPGGKLYRYARRD